MKVWGCQSEDYDAITHACAAPAWFDIPGAWPDVPVTDFIPILQALLFLGAIIVVFRAVFQVVKFDIN